MINYYIMASRDDLLFKIKLAEQAERFEDMVNFANELVKMGKELSNEERNLLSVAYKNSIGARRTAWRALVAIEAKDQEKGGKHVEIIKQYKKKVEQELEKIAQDVIAVLDNYLINSVPVGETKIFYLKMKGDYYRYWAESLVDARQKEIGLKASEAYQTATTSAEELPKTNPIKLGLALNYSVFHYEILNEPDKAIKLAKTAFDSAIQDLDKLEDEVYKDSASIMQLLRDNLTLWTSEKGEKGDEKEDEK